KFSPTAATLATTSPGPATGSGISASTRSSGAPKRWQRMAFTGARPLERCRHAIARRRWLKDKGRASGITFFVCILWRRECGGGGRWGGVSILLHLAHFSKRWVLLGVSPFRLAPAGRGGGR